MPGHIGRAKLLLSRNAGWEDGNSTAEKMTRKREGEVAAEPVWEDRNSATEPQRAQRSPAFFVIPAPGGNPGH